MTTHDPDFEQGLADVARASGPHFEPEEAQAFAAALNALNRAGVPYVVAGAFAKHAYTGVWRDTKDLDIFLKPDDLKTALDALAAAGYETAIEFEHWLAKAHRQSYVVDLIFGTGQGQIQIDDSWFANSRSVEIAGAQTRLIAIEDLIVSKAYIAERYRFDGADVIHLIRSARGQIDWQRVLAGLGKNRELLLWHLILFDFVYPGHAGYLPQELMGQLFDQVRRRWAREWNPKAFRGTLLDPFSFIADIADWGYEDRRDLDPLVDEEGEVI